MRARTLQSILSDTDLTDGAQRVLLALFSFADADGTCWPGNDKLREVLGGMPEPTLNRHLARLREVGAATSEYDRSRRRRTFRINLSRYGIAPITSDSCTVDAPITSDSRTYHQRESHLSPVIAAPITSDRPNKNGPENGPENGPGTVAEPAPAAEVSRTPEAEADPDPEAALLARPGIETAEAALGLPAKPRQRFNPRTDPVWIEAADAVDMVDTTGSWGGKVYQFASQIKHPEWLAEAATAAALEEATDFRLVLAILRRYERQGGPDSVVKARSWGNGGGYRNAEPRLTPVPPERPREPEILRIEDMTPEQIEAGRKGLEELKARVLNGRQAL